jgi:hypothetical protein
MSLSQKALVQPPPLIVWKGFRSVVNRFRSTTGGGRRSFLEKGACSAPVAEKERKPMPVRATARPENEEIEKQPVSGLFRKIQVGAG